MNNSKQLKKQSFTLIEVLITIGVISLALPVLFSIVFTIMRQQSRVTKLSIVKREGDLILNQMITRIRSEAILLYNEGTAANFEVCASNASPNTYGIPQDIDRFLDRRGIDFGYRAIVPPSNYNDAYLELFSGATTPSRLHSSKVRVERVTASLLSCIRKNAFSTPVVLINFKVSFKETSPPPEGPTSMVFQTRVKIRNQDQ